MKLDARTRTLSYCFAAGCVLVVGIFMLREESVQYRLQDAHISMTGSAAVARAYGDASFNATYSGSYDIKRAKVLYERAARLNPLEPLLAYQSGRIAFLEGRFPDAEMFFDYEIEKNSSHPPAVYYMRALNRAFMGDFLGASKDYEIYFTKTPAGWASINDYSWVLIRLKLYGAAEEALSWGLQGWPTNPWLLNSMATTLYEQKKYAEAEEYVGRALREVGKITDQEWHTAYPGNDPRMAPQAIEEFMQAVSENSTKIAEALAQ